MRALSTALIVIGLLLLFSVPTRIAYEEQSLKASVMREFEAHTLSAETSGTSLNGTISIPSEDMRAVLMPGVTPEELDKGVGYYPGTALPGQEGNFAIAVHRPLIWNIDSMGPGDEIIITNNGVDYTYEFRESFVVKPEAVEVLEPLGGKWLTLTTCHPRYSNAERLIVRAELTSVGR